MKKYHKVNKENYEKWYGEYQVYKDRVKPGPSRLTYHLMPETGWLSDPNGLYQLHGPYRIYYQYTPFEPADEIRLWGYYTTKDFVRYTSEEPVLSPDHGFDVRGVYSDSASVEDGTIHYFHTGDVKCFGKDDHDRIMSGQESSTIYLSSKDGHEFLEKMVLMTNRDYPANMNCHIHDSKVFYRESTYCMALRARNRENKGMVLLYRLRNLKDWEHYSRITTEAPLGYTRGCPGLFWLDGQLCLTCCPQGVVPRGVDFWNVHQCTVMGPDHDFGTNTYHMNRLEDNQEKVLTVDKGFGFYTPQTFENETGRRILTGRVGIPNADCTNPITQTGWQHALTIPRVLRWVGEHLIQTPVEELRHVCCRGRTYDLGQLNETGEKEIVYEARFQFGACNRVTLTPRVEVTLNYENRPPTLNMGGKGSGRANRSVVVGDLREPQMFSDTSSLEVFVNGGEGVFATKVYGMEGGIRVDGACSGCVDLYGLSRFIYEQRRGGLRYYKQKSYRQRYYKQRYSGDMALGHIPSSAISRVIC